MTLTQRKEIGLGTGRDSHERLHGNGTAVLGAGEIRASQQRRMDCAGGAVARTRARSDLLASSEEAPPAGDACRTALLLVAEHDEPTMFVGLKSDIVACPKSNRRHPQAWLDMKEAAN